MCHGDGERSVGLGICWNFLGVRRTLNLQAKTHLLPLRRFLMAFSQAELRELKRSAQDAKSLSKKESVLFLKGAGILTAGGKVAKQYRGVITSAAKPRMKK